MRGIRFLDNDAEAGLGFGSPVPLRHEMFIPYDASIPWHRISSLGSTAVIECRPRAASIMVQMPVPAPTSAASISIGGRPTRARIAVATLVE